MRSEALLTSSYSKDLSPHSKDPLHSYHHCPDGLRCIQALGLHQH